MTTAPGTARRTAAALPDLLLRPSGIAADEEPALDAPVGVSDRAA